LVTVPSVWADVGASVARVFDLVSDVGKAVVASVLPAVGDEVKLSDPKALGAALTGSLETDVVGEPVEMEDVAALGCGLIVGLPVGLDVGPDVGLSVSSVMGGGMSSTSPVQLSSQGMEATNAAVKPPTVLSGAQGTSKSFTPARLSP
jgi:hypothetical protein